jgi:hypothetical protein
MMICGELSRRTRLPRQIRTFFIDSTGELWVSPGLGPGESLVIMALAPVIRGYRVGKKYYPYVQASVVRREYSDCSELLTLLDRMANVSVDDSTAQPSSGRRRASS